MVADNDFQPAENLNNNYVSADGLTLRRCFCLMGLVNGLIFAVSLLLLVDTIDFGLLVSGRGIFTVGDSPLCFTLSYEKISNTSILIWVVVSMLVHVAALVSLCTRRRVWLLLPWIIQYSGAMVMMFLVIPNFAIAPLTLFVFHALRGMIRIVKYGYMSTY